MLTAWNSFKEGRRKAKPRLAAWHWAALGLLLAAAALLGTRWWRASATVAAEKRVAVSAAKRDTAPLERVSVLVFKSERIMEVWGQRAGESRWGLLREYPILAANGSAGPKLRDGDRQIPEGVYRAKSVRIKAGNLHAIEVDFPNEFDVRAARGDGRAKPSGTPQIVGKTIIPGAVSIGDEALQDLCGMTESVRNENIRLIFCPNDLRKRIPVRNPNLKLPWVDELYATLKRELLPYK